MANRNVEYSEERKTGKYIVKGHECCWPRRGLWGNVFRVRIWGALHQYTYSKHNNYYVGHTMNQRTLSMEQKL